MKRALTILVLGFAIAFFGMVAQAQDDTAAEHVTNCPESVKFFDAAQKYPMSCGSSAPPPASLLNAHEAALEGVWRIEFQGPDGAYSWLAAVSKGIDGVGYRAPDAPWLMIGEFRTYPFTPETSAQRVVFQSDSYRYGGYTVTGQRGDSAGAMTGRWQRGEDSGPATWQKLPGPVIAEVRSRTAWTDEEGNHYTDSTSPGERALRIETQHPVTCGYGQMAGNCPLVHVWVRGQNLAQPAAVWLDPRSHLQLVETRFILDGQSVPTHSAMKWNAGSPEVTEVLLTFRARDGATPGPEVLWFAGQSIALDFVIHDYPEPMVVDINDQEPCAEVVLAELEELGNQHQVLLALRDLNEVTAAIRSNIRPTDLAYDEPGMARLMREALTLGERLSSELKTASSLAKKGRRISDAAKLAQQAAAMADLPIRLVKAIETAQTSSGREKIEDLNQIVKDAKVIVGVLATINPVVGAYLEVLSLAVEDIARNAQAIEAAVSRTNSIIAQVDEAIGRTARTDETATEIDRALQKLETAIREHERQCDEAAYGEVVTAEGPCLSAHGLNLQTLGDLRFEVTRRLPNRLNELQASLDSIQTARLTLPDLIQIEQEALADLELTARSDPSPEKRLDAINRVPSQKQRVIALRNNLSRIEAAGPQKATRLRELIAEAQQQLQEQSALLDAFNDCVRNRLRDAKHAGVGYLADRFPQYMPDM